MTPLIPLNEVLNDAPLFTDGDWVESKDQDINGDVRLTQLADVGDGEWLNKSKRYMTSTKAGALKCTFLQAGDVLVARMPEPLGRCCIFPGDSMPCVTVVDVCVIRPNSIRVFPRYLMHAINAPGVRQSLKKYIVGTTRQRISRKNLGHIRIPLPTLDEQVRTATALDAVSRVRDNRRKSLRQIGRLTQAIFFSMFGDTVTNPRRLPVMPLADALADAEVFNDGDWVESKDQDPEGDVRLTQLADVGDGNWLNKSKRFLTSQTARNLRCTYLKPGDVLIARMPEPLGRCCIFPGDAMPCVTVVDVCIVRANPKKLLSHYLMAAINSPCVRSSFHRHISGTTRKRISKKNLSKVQILVPPLADQRRFTSSVEEIAKHADLLKSHLNQLEILFSSLQRDAFRSDGVI